MLKTRQPIKSVFKKRVNWKDLYFYQKTDALYQLTAVFCQRYFPKFGNRTVDQMIQAARSGKQNIVEGSEDGITSSEMEIKLINVARSSIHELREDYEDYLKTNQLPIWDERHDRYNDMLEYCREHNQYSEYERFVERWSDEELANLALTLCHLTDKMMTSYLKKLEEQFVTEGGIKERMHAARTGYRQQRDLYVKDLQKENLQMKCELLQKEQEIEQLKRRIETLENSR